MRTLVLNAGYEPLAVVSFKRALVLVMNDKATVIEHIPEDPVVGYGWRARSARGHPAQPLRSGSRRTHDPGDSSRRASP